MWDLKSGIRAARGGAFFLPLLLALPAVAGAQATGTVAGRVTGPGGDPVANASILLVGSNRGTVTDRAGSFVLPAVPAGDQQIVVRYMGFQEDTASVAVTSGAISSLDLALQVAPIAMEGITVTGERGSQLRAINRERMAATVTDVVTGDDIGRLPDQNVAEAVQRIPGMAMRTSRGEGRFVSIRGTAPNLNNVTLNGQPLASTAESRATALDLLPAGMVSSIEVVKAITPDMDGNAVGGTINLETLSAFEQDRSFLFGSVEGLFHQQQVDYLDDKFPFEVDVTAGTRFGPDRTWGIVVSGSASRRDFSASVLDPDGYEEVDGNILPNELELQVADNERERYGITSNLDWRPRPGTELFLRGLYTHTREVEANSEFEITFEGDLEMQTPTVGRYTAGSIELDLSEGDERESLYAFTLGGRQRLLEGLTWDVSGTFTRGVLDDIGPDATFETPEEEEARASTTFDVEPYFFLVEPEDPGYISDPSNYPLRSASWNLQSNREDMWVFASNLRLDRSLGSFPAFLKVGGKVQRRGKVIDDSSFRYVPLGITLAPYALPAAGTVQGGSEAFLHGDVGSFTRFFAANRGDSQQFELDAAETALQAVENDSDNLETITAGYLMGNVEAGRLSVTAGVRVERTDTESRRNEVYEDEETEELEVTDRTFDTGYTTVLPSAVLKFNATDNLIFRAAWTNSIGRPDYEELAGFREVQYRPTAVPNVFEGSVTEGNPELKPYEATNLDAFVEYYFPSGGMLSAGGFWKRIDNPIYEFEVTRRDVTFEGRQYAELVIRQDLNADAGTLRGIELSWAQPLIFLPYPFDGFGIAANAAFIDSEVSVPGRDEKLPLFGQSDRVFNLVPYYQRGPLELRAAWTYRGEFLDDVGEEVFLDRYGDSRTTIDLSARLRLNRWAEVIAQARNVTNEPEVGYQGIRSRYDVHTLTGRTVTFGVSVNY